MSCPEEGVGVVLDLDGFMVRPNSDPPELLPGIGEVLRELSHDPRIIPVVWTLSERERLEAAMESLGRAGYAPEVEWLSTTRMYSSEDNMLGASLFKKPSRVGARIIVDDDQTIAEAVNKDGGVYVNPEPWDSERVVDWKKRVVCMVTSAVSNVIACRAFEEVEN